VHQADRHNILFLASALTFDTLLAAIPYLLLLLVGLTHVAHLSPTLSAEDVHQLYRRFVPPMASAGADAPFGAVERVVVSLVRARTRISLYAAPLFLWFATRLFASVRTALTLVYDVPRRPQGSHFVVSYLAGKLRDVAMVILTVALAVANTFLTAGLRALETWRQGAFAPVPALEFLVSGLGTLITGLIAFGFLVLLFYLVYRHAAPRRLSRRAAFTGAVFTALLFELAKRLFGWYLRHVAVAGQFSANANITAVILFVLWMYYTALVFLVGAVAAETWDLRARARTSGGFRG
jgi:membrane protein